MEYSKLAKYKKVLECIELPDEVLLQVVLAHAAWEGYDKFVHVDYYWHHRMGLFVIIDGPSKILEWYKNYHIFSKSIGPTFLDDGKLIWSKPIGEPIIKSY